MPECSYKDCQFDWVDEWTFYDKEGKPWCGMHAPQTAKTIDGEIKSRSKIVQSFFECVDNVWLHERPLVDYIRGNYSGTLSLKGIVFPDAYHNRTLIKSSPYNCNLLGFSECSGGNVIILNFDEVGIVDSYNLNRLRFENVSGLSIDECKIGVISYQNSISDIELYSIMINAVEVDRMFLDDIRVNELTIANSKVHEMCELTNITVNDRCDLSFTIFHTPIIIKNTTFSVSTYWEGTQFIGSFNYHQGVEFRKLKMLCRGIGDDIQAKYFEDLEIKCINSLPININTKAVGRPNQTNELIKLYNERLDNDSRLNSWDAEIQFLIRNRKNTLTDIKPSSLKKRITKELFDDKKKIAENV